MATRTGTAGSEILDGTAGDDVLDGLGGNDTLRGGAGRDTATYAAAPSAVTATLVAAVAGATGGAGRDRFESIENLIGSKSADTLTGNDHANRLEGGDGADVLSGGLGADTLLGGAGADGLTGGLGDDVLDGGAGIDFASYATASSGVRVSLAVTGRQNTLSAGWDTLISIEQLRGSNFADQLTGNDGANTLRGLGGDDVLFGNGGTDVLWGEAGDDQLSGGDANDTLLGGLGADRLDGGAGADHMTGGVGDDFYVVGDAGDIVVEVAGGGVDTVRAGSDFTLPAFVENFEEVWQGHPNAQYHGNTLNNVMVAGEGVLFGEGGDDRLFVVYRNGTLNGGPGDDVLSYADDMTGGSGRDKFVLNEDSVTNARINDFSRGEGDKIDLSALDPDWSSFREGDQTLIFVGANGFSRREGEMRVTNSGYVNTYNLWIDMDGNGAWDTYFTVVSSTSLLSSDFIL